MLVTEACQDMRLDAGACHDMRLDAEVCQDMHEVEIRCIYSQT